MHFDALTLACITAELNTTICPGRIQQVLRVDEHALGCEVYTPGTRHQLLLALAPSAARVQLVSHKLRRGVDGETPLLLLLRKYARGALIAAIEQPDPTERVLRFQLEHAEVGATMLVIELIGRQPNAILLNPTGRILDCLHRLPATGEGRALLPGQQYRAPSAPDKLSPFDNGADDYYARLAQIVAQPGPLWKTLVAGIAGLSPTAAREIAWRVQGEPEAGGDTAESNTAEGNPASVLAVAQALQELWAPVQTGAWQPGLIEEDATLVGFAAYPVHFRGRFSAQPSMSAALARYFAESNVTRAVDAYAAQRAQVQAQVKRAQGQVTRRLAALAGDEPAPGAADVLRTQANWLLALSSQVQSGQTVLEVDTGAEPLHIELDALYTPIEQAQRMFKRAAKLERAALAIPRRRAELLADRALLDQLTLDGERAANQPELAAVVDELQRAGFGRAAASRAQRPTAPAGGPLRFRTQHGAEIVVGRNARQNEQVTFKLARPDDAWLHVRGTPGAHVIVRSPSHPPDARDLEAAAQLAAYHSSVRGERRVDVIVTERRWVSRAPGGRTGQVMVTRERVLSVPAEEPETLIPLAGQKE
ncbi:NFACT RNA binding domain-containing protein [Caldilinea sp.]|uniref:Rqc2 family fibronectin-binding protein n=1 Tax=Caldilinea sp. TaxID=2293560 RepID=UPI002C4FB6C4|nr:NFACT RNA binding domain-containing protein [Caldilinea sp.]HRA67779.1 NFACT RNA binding domain-containing protein [Caldilinea sp.]